MKRASVIVMAVALSAVLGVARAEDVYSVNTVGFVKKSLPAGGVIMTTSNFDPIGGGTNTLLSIFGTNQLKQAATIGQCDLVRLFDTGSSSYTTWAQYTDGVFYQVVGGNWGNAGNPIVKSGQGMWVIAGGGATTKDLVFMGEVVDAGTQQVAIVTGPQIISYPFSSSVGIQEAAFDTSGAKGASTVGGADLIRVWTGAGYNTYALYSGDGKWYPVVAGNWGNDAASNTLALAEGFWYIAKSNFWWSTTNKYLNNL